MSKVYFDPANLPPLGSRVRFTRWNAQTHREEEQQMFYLAAARRHTTKKGADSAVLHWDTDCEDCGEQFTFTSGLSTGAMYRRCPSCRPLLKREGGWPTGPRMKHTLLDPEPGYEPPPVAMEANLSREEKRALRKARAAAPNVGAIKEPECELDPWDLLGSSERMAMLRQAKAELGQGASRDAIEAKARATLMSLF